MKVQINGQWQELETGTTVRRVLEQRKISPNVVACELNLTILKRASLGETVLKEGDVLEVIQMIGGG